MILRSMLHICSLHNIIPAEGISFSEKNNSPVAELAIGIKPSRYKAQVQYEQNNLSLAQLKQQGEKLRDKISGDIWRSY